MRKEIVCLRIDLEQFCPQLSLLEIDRLLYLLSILIRKLLSNLSWMCFPFVIMFSCTHFVWICLTGINIIFFQFSVCSFFYKYRDLTFATNEFLMASQETMKLHTLKEASHIRSTLETRKDDVTKWKSQ